MEWRHVPEITPMFRQYYEIKNEYSDCILMFRLGDFYEMFGEDAELAARELELTLTSRESGLGKMPMAGVPYHSAEPYITKLVKNNYKVAICEQVEDPKATKGIVKREVVRVITPGTITDTAALNSKTNNYLCTISSDGRNFGLCYVDVSTGELGTTEITGNEGTRKLKDELVRLSPAECIIDDAVDNELVLLSLKEEISVELAPYDYKAFNISEAEKLLKEHFNVTSLDGLGLKGKGLAISAVGASLDYLRKMQKVALEHINDLRVYSTYDYMVIDSTARRNLELTNTIKGESEHGSLLWVIDKTVTPMGSRELRSWLDRPLINLECINDRLDAVNEFVNNMMLTDDLREKLKKVYDLKRLISKTVYGSATARDLVSIKNSLEQLPDIKDSLSQAQAKLIGALNSNIDCVEDISTLIKESIKNEPPVSIKDGYIINEGYDEEVDRLRKLMTSGKNWVADLEANERQKTGIKSLKVGFNKVFGYYIEVTKSNLHLVPEDYIRKQTLSNAERYITPDLKERETEILTAEERVKEREYELFTLIRDKVCAQASRIQKTADAIARIDCLISFAKVSLDNNYVRPELSSNNMLNVKDGRHPSVELLLKREFVPNDIQLGEGRDNMVLLTGPNMSGKSTYGKSVLIVQVMAQIGCFVPASEAVIGIVDRIFVRAGSTEDISAGQSTFMLELLDTASILHSATDKSLIFIDELGRGTGTYDGMAISRAVIEYIHNKIRARTIVSTHYHDLTELEAELENLRNYHVSAVEKNGELIFIYRVQRGGTDRSYGINVAKMAGIPEIVIKRAMDVLKRLEEERMASKHEQLNLFDSLSVNEKDNPCNTGIKDNSGNKGNNGNNDYKTKIHVSNELSQLLDELKEVDTNNITPVQALFKLDELKKMAESSKE